MSERNGTIVHYNPTNRQGEIAPEEGGPHALFYVRDVTNADPAPKARDKVTFDAPDARKNKQGKIIQGNATSVTITERSPDLPPPVRQPEPRRQSANARRGREGRGGPRRNDRRGGPSRGERRSGPPRRPDRSHDQAAPSIAAQPTGDAPESKEHGTGRRRTVELKDKGRRREGRRPARDRGKSRRPGPTAGKREHALAVKAEANRFPLAADLRFESICSAEVHPGLLRDRFLAWPARKAEQHTDAAPGGAWGFREKNKEYFLERVFLPAYQRHAARGAIWELLQLRRKSLVESYRDDGYAVREFHAAAAGKLAVQLWRTGVASAFGTALDHMMGAPVLPGAALKGAALRSSRLSGGFDADSGIFGRSGEAGKVLFLDGVPIRPVRKALREGILNRYPHYYSGSRSPSDDQEPQSTSFFSLAEGGLFSFVLVSRPEDAAELDRAEALLRTALEDIGIGARTSSGCGFFRVRSAAAKKAEPQNTDGGEAEV